MPPQKGQRQARGLVRQQQIVEVAFVLFATHGYRSTSLAAIAAGVGITEAGVLHHFESKDAVLEAVLAHRDATDPDTEAWVAEPGGGLESLRRIPALAGILVDNPLLAQFDAVVGGESLAEGGPPAAHFRRRLRSIRTAIARAIAAGIEGGEIAADVDAEAVATEIVGFMDGIQTQWLLDPNRVDLVAAYRHYIEGLVTQLGGRQ
jgi:AcrR family transcriptional regulator